MSERSGMANLRARTAELSVSSDAATAAFSAFWAVAGPYFEQHGAPQGVIDTGIAFSRAYSAFARSARAFGAAIEASALTAHD